MRLINNECWVSTLVPRDGFLDEFIVVLPVHKINSGHRLRRWTFPTMTQSESAVNLAATMAARVSTESLDSSSVDGWDDEGLSAKSSSMAGRSQGNGESALSHDRGRSVSIGGFALLKGFFSENTTRDLR